MKIIFSYRAGHGFSLVELLVALALSSLLLAGMFQIFASNKQAFALQNGVSRMQENGRIAMEVMTKNLRSAGFMGCATEVDGSSFENIIDSTKYTVAGVSELLDVFNGAATVQVINSVVDADSTFTGLKAPLSLSLNDVGISVAADLASASQGELIAGTDVILLQYVEACEGLAVNGGGSDLNTLSVADLSACGIGADTLVLVADCNNSEAFGVTSITDNSAANDLIQLDVTNNVQGNLANFYDSGAFVYLPRFIMLYIAKGANDSPALYMKRLRGENAKSGFDAPLEIAQDVESFQILLGEDDTSFSSADGSVSRYVDTAATNFDMDRVLAVQTSFQARSETGLAKVGDTRLRITYQSTNTIRNRID